MTILLEHLSDSVIDDVLPLAHEYQVDWLVERCEATLLERYLPDKGSRREEIDEEDPRDKLLKFIYYGDTYSLSTLRKRAIKYLSCCHIRKIKEYNHFNWLSEKTQHEIFEKRVEMFEKGVEKDNRYSGVGGYLQNIFMHYCFHWTLN